MAQNARKRYVIYLLSDIPSILLRSFRNMTGEVGRLSRIILVDFHMITWRKRGKYPQCVRVTCP